MLWDGTQFEVFQLQSQFAGPIQRGGPVPYTGLNGKQESVHYIEVNVVKTLTAFCAQCDIYRQMLKIIQFWE